MKIAAKSCMQKSKKL